MTSNKGRIRQRAGDGLYQIQWESQTLLMLPQSDHFHDQRAQAQPQTQHYLRQQSPPLTSSYQVANAGATVWGYNMFLGASLATWLLYLLLPRGVRKQYFSAKRKRYVRSDDKDMPAAGYWLPVKRQGAGNFQNDHSARSPPRSSPLPLADVTPDRPPRHPSSSVPPSPDHPGLHKIPPNKIIAETMARLQGRGIRLVAHGVHCNPKRVWIKLDDDATSVTWQTEFPRRVPNQAGQVSIVLMRGSLHKIALCNVLYIDVGKKTNALQQLPENVPAPCCFSLLTQNGSLDLQANSKLERDASVSCFSMILDDVHAEDWRAIYEATPEPSLVNSSIANGSEPRVGKGALLMELRK
jgi:hypothetical protein